MSAGAPPCPASFSTGPLVTLEGVSLFLPGDRERRTILHHITWQMENGGHCALLGPNGSGKSTLLRLLHGELWPATGRIVWHTAQGPETSLLAGRAISALVSPAQQEQWQRQAWDINGLDILLTGLADTPLLYSRPPAAQHALAEALARQLRAEHLLKRSLPTLSQGQLRTLLLGRALMRAPRLLLLDECCDGLDAAHRNAFFDLLESHSAQTTVIFTAHRPEQIPSWCCERRWLDQGQLLATAPALRRTSTETMRCTEPRAPLVPAVIGPHALFRLKNVSVYVDRHKVLHDIHWSMHQGEHWRICGANGSGKSTLLRLLAGDEFAAAGGSIERFLPGQGCMAKNLAQIRRGIRLVSDLSQALYDYPLTGLELVCSGFDNSVGIYRDFSQAETAEARAIMDSLLGAEESRMLATASIQRLSSGQLRRLFLARALVGRPDILLLDEPCSNLDTQARDHYLALLDQLAATGLHMVMVSHYGEDAPLCINRGARMVDGRLEIISPAAHLPLAAAHSLS